MRDDDPQIGVMVLNRNGAGWLGPLFDSLRRDDYARKRVYLVDNASEDDSVALTLSRYPEVKILRMPQNLGYCMAYNLAMPYAFDDGCEWVGWVNNDVLLEPGCFRELARVAVSAPRMGVVGPAFLAWQGDEPNEYMLGNHPYAIAAMRSGSAVPLDVTWVEGSLLMVNRRCFESVGPLDPYLGFYWEEADFCRRARYQGWRVALVPSARARHYAGGSRRGGPPRAPSLERRQSRNYYVYQLANPFQGFWWNLLDMFHLFAVMVRAALAERPSATASYLAALRDVLGDIRAIHEKWRRDRLGEPPPALEGEMVSYLACHPVKVIAFS